MFEKVNPSHPDKLCDRIAGAIVDMAYAEHPDPRKYEYLEFPQADVWGLVFPENDRLAEKEVITVNDLIGLPLFCSEQAYNDAIRNWAGNRFSELHLEGSFRLSYNGSVFAREGLGYLLTFANLIDTSEGSGLTFRYLSPKLETRIYLAWNKYQTFTPIAERFLRQVQKSFTNKETTPESY